VSAASGVALLVGLFAVPALLLAAGHRLRERSPRSRRAFWGGVIGHSAALAVTLVASHFPPVLWESDARVLLVFWLMAAGGLVGAGVGAALGRR
jgi:hypothetical protein